MGVGEKLSKTAGERWLPGRLAMKTSFTMAPFVAVFTKSTAESSRQLQKWKVLG